MTSRIAKRAFLAVFAFCQAAAAQSTPPRKDIPSIAKAANGSIVSIVMSDDKGKPIAQGTGFFVTKDGLIVTNYHVIAQGSSAVATLPDGATYVLEGVVASDKARDVAVVKATGKNFRKLMLGNSDRVEVGQEVVAIGNPLFLESTVSNGIISGIRTEEQLGGKFLQVTAPISPGSSGGPLFDMADEVIGITTLYLKGGENLNFAIPINDAKRLLTGLQAGPPGFTPWVQPWPNEPESSKAQEHESDASSSESTTASGPDLKTKQAVPEEHQESSWLSTDRFDTSAFSARYPRRRSGDQEVNCKAQEGTTDKGRKATATRCVQRTENGGVDALIMYIDLPFEPTRDMGAESVAEALDEMHFIPLDRSTTNQPSWIARDQSFAALPPIKALESSASGTFNGVPAKVCARWGSQGRRQWLLLARFADSTKHTKADCDAFFDSIVVK
jgi:Trypsin-like peptidase domain